MTNPGVQKPHWKLCESHIACCSVLSPPSGASPSIVVTSLPAAWTASIRHERTARPSTITVHAPQAPCSQPTWVPVRSRSSRRKSASVLRASGEPVRVAPLILTVMSGISYCLSRALSAAARRPRRTTVAATVFR